MGSILLDEKTHTYTVDGQKKPGVHEILTELGFIDKRFMLDTADFGIAVHQGIEYWLRGTFDEYDWDPQILPYVDGAKLFCREWGFVPDLIEQPLYSKHGFCGKIDASGHIKDQSCLIVDWKSYDHPYWWDALAMGGYYQLVLEWKEATASNGSVLSPPHFVRRATVHLHGDGTYTPKDHSDRIHHAAYMCCAGAYNYKLNKGGIR